MGLRYKNPNKYMGFKVYLSILIEQKTSAKLKNLGIEKPPPYISRI